MMIIHTRPFVAALFTAAVGGDATGIVAKMQVREF